MSDDSTFEALMRYGSLDELLGSIDPEILRAQTRLMNLMFPALSNVPSTAYLAACPDMEKALGLLKATCCQRYWTGPTPDPIDGDN